MDFAEWLGDVFGVPGGINNIGSGYAGLIGVLVVMLGWLVTARRESNKYRIERAHETVLMENEKLKEPMGLLVPFLRTASPFPIGDELRSKRELASAIFVVMNNLELLALDIATGRASELYVKGAQRALINRICICAQPYISGARSGGQSGAYKQLEVLFIRFYMNRSPYFQWILEYLYGKPIFRYSYLVFQLRYAIAISIWGLKTSFRDEPWQEVGKCMRRIRRGLDVVGYSAIILGVWYWVFC